MPDRGPSRTTGTTGAGRPGAGTTDWSERLGRWYLTVLTTAVVGSLLVAAVLHLTDAAGCTAPAPCLTDGQRPALAGSLSVLLLGLLGAGARALGPLGVTAGEATWLLSTPAARGRLLLPGLVRALLVAAALGAAGGTAVGLLALGPDVALAGRATGWAAPGAGVGPIALLGAASSVGVVAGLVLLQVRAAATGAPGRPVRAVTLLGALATAAVVLLPGPLLPGSPLPDLLLPGATTGGASLPLGLVAGLTVLGAAAVTAVAVLRLDRMPVRVLLGPGSARRSVVGAVLRLDTDVLGTAGAPPGHRRGWARLRLPRQGGVWTALVVVGALAVTSRPERVLDALVLLVVPLVVASLLGTPAGLAAATAVATALATRTAVPVRALTRSASLQRSLPVDLRRARAALLVAPGLVVLVWALLAALVTGAPAWQGLALAGAALAGAVRSATPPAGDAGALMMTEAGPVPLGTVSDPLRGADAAALAVLPLLLGAPVWLALAAPPLVLLALLRSGPR
ncbi:DUF6297 family protein [Aquipuribacter sp. MA13-6]|uniref:DUF6297 family protein n=1 Tax=unclassified Aquipuribacter TaxID=2635084 RepID=UPI003EEE239A